MDDLVNDMQSVMIESPDENFRQLKELTSELKTMEPDEALVDRARNFLERVNVFILYNNSSIFYCCEERGLGKSTERDVECDDCTIVRMIKETKVHKTLDEYIKSMIKVNEFIIKVIQETR
jgi:hypothetical protein